MSRSARNPRAFSLIELVIVVVIIGIIGAIAIPRLSRGATGASSGALKGNLAVMRSAIELYAAEHEGLLPGKDSAGNSEDVATQLTTYTDINGSPNPTKTTVFVYGPYLKSVPPLPVGAEKGSTGIAAAAAAGVGWIYDSATGAIRSNTTASETDDKGVKYSDY
jgi:prepilin-type N-terminal cleavage/methylation domain-containing protein